MNSFGKITDIIRRLNDLVWGPWMLVILLSAGVYLMVMLRFLPIRNLGRALLTAVFGAGKESSLIKCSERDKDSKVSGISPMSALATELAATIGTGNIAGVSTALVLGGPGALFWMIVSGVFGMALKLTENTLSVKYKSRNELGEPVGGPMYVLRDAFPLRKSGRVLGSIFAVLAILASLGMGNMTQSNSVADALNVSFGIEPAFCGLILTIVTILVNLGGIRSIAAVAGIVVPIMGTLYLAGAFIVIGSHWQSLPCGIIQILVMAFSPEAIAGGTVGTITVTALESMRWGVSRGVFSNEAGLGVSGISAASAHTSDAVRQGYISMTGVFLDTIVICTVTGLTIVVSGVLGMVDVQGSPITGTELTMEAFRTTFGEAGVVFIGVSITLFAFATIVGWAYQGEKAFEFLVKKRKYCIYYRFVYSLAVFVGAVSSLEAVWNFSDLCNGLLVFPNLAGVLVLSPGICREIRAYYLVCGRKSC